MSPRIVVLYSQSSHFPRAVEAMRDGEITALVPAGRGGLRAVLPVGVTVKEMARAPGTGRLAQAWAVLRHLRAAKADRLCVLYPSPALRILAALSGARERCWCGEDGVARPLDETIAAVFADLVMQRLRGEARYAALWLVVHCTRAKGNRP